MEKIGKVGIEGKMNMGKIGKEENIGKKGEKEM